MIDVLIGNWNRVRAGLLATAIRFTDEDLAFRPAPRGYSIAETLLHIANEEDGEVRYGITRELADFPAPFEASRFPTKAAVLSALAQLHDRTLTYLATLTDADLDGIIETPWGLRRRLDLLFHVVEHEIHHRGELSLMLGLLAREGLDA
jgi:uncharacterized damage-inducible protein DinB